MLLLGYIGFRIKNRQDGAFRVPLTYIVLFHEASFLLDHQYGHNPRSSGPRSTCAIISLSKAQQSQQESFSLIYKSSILLHVSY